MGVKVRKPKGHTSWCVVIDHEGRRKTQAVGSREAAERVKREIEARLAVGAPHGLEPEKPACPTLEEYSRTWLAEVEQDRKPSTAGFYGQYLRLYVVPHFGPTRLDAILRDGVKRFINELRQRKFAKNTIRLAVTTVRALLNAAIEDGWLKHNPAQGLGRFVKSEKPKRQAVSLTPQEVQTLLKAAEASLSLGNYALLLTALRAGLREGELAGLRWSDIHFGANEQDRERYLLVQRNYDRRWSRAMLTPKNRKARRVDMSRELQRVLWTLRNQRSLEKASRDFSDDLVFPSGTGTPIEMNNFAQRVFGSLLKRAGLRRIRFHDLRHRADSWIMPTSRVGPAREALAAN